MSKQALHFMIDVGNGIDKNYSNSSDCTRLKLALNCFALTLQQKLVNNPTHQFGFSIFGDNDSDDGNNQLLYPIQKPNLDLVRKVKQMSQTSLSNDKQGGDIFSAIQHIILIFRDYIGKKKYNKRAFLFTAGYGQTTYQQSELKHIIANLQVDGIKLNIIPIDFLKNYNIFQNMTKDEIYANQNQRRNAELLIKLKNYGPDNVQIFTTQIAIELYSKFRTKDTNPVVLFKGDLQIAPGFNLPVASFKCIRKQRLLSLGKYDTSVQYDPLLTKEKQIINDITYICQGDQSGTIVAPQNIVKAFPYGPNLVPINNIIQPSMKIYEQKNFKLLGFVDRDKIPRQSFMGQMQIVVPYDNGKSHQEMSIAKKLFTALIYSMKQNKKYAVARYIPRNSKTGVNPRLVGLIPNISGGKIMLYLVDLPTVEDVRQYPFNSLKKATQKQRQIIKQLVDRMSLLQVEDGQQIDKLKSQNTFNPVRQYFFQTVFHRALQNQTQIPILDPIIKEYITPQLKFYQQTKNLTNQIKTEFKMSKKQLAKQKIAQQKTLRWMDILSTNRDTDQYSQASYQMPLKKFNLQQNKDEQFNTLKPIQSFRDMLNNNRKDLVDTALLEMSQYIEKKSLNISSAHDIQHLIQCSMKLRQGCIQQKQTQFWDNWFETLKDKVGKTVPDRLKQRGYGFISTKRNTIYYKAETFNPINMAIADDLD